MKLLGYQRDHRLPRLDEKVIVILYAKEYKILNNIKREVEKAEIKTDIPDMDEEIDISASLETLQTIMNADKQLAKLEKEIKTLRQELFNQRKNEL